MPITHEVHQVLYKDKDASKAVYELMARELKGE
jgi:glycerol-3-phosphate dehydrogenase